MALINFFWPLGVVLIISVLLSSPPPFSGEEVIKSQLFLSPSPSPPPFFINDKLYK